ncbi:MAG TPA: hypothetical protein VIJ42_17320 [Stellaceae bacterium]
MSLSDYTATRVFESPFLRRTEMVSGSAVISTLLLGPLYYWRKQAPIEATILFTANLILFVVSLQNWSSGPFATSYPGLILWLGSALLAPILLPLCYRRKGWIEIVVI